MPFLNEHLRNGGEKAYSDYVDFLDNLPSFELSKEESDYIEECTSIFDMKNLKEVNKGRLDAVENPEERFEENKDDIKDYEEFKMNEKYLSSPIKRIQDKLQKYMIDNKYYDIAIPLIRKFSESYDNYYIKLLEANEKFLKMKDE